MIAPGKAFPLVESPWSWPIDLTSYDCSPGLTEAERQEIALVAVRSGGPGNSGMRPKRSYQVLHRLLTPLVDIGRLIQENYTDWTNQNRRASTIRAFVLEMNRRQTSFWAWDEREWIEFIAASLEEFNTRLGWSWRRDSKPEAGTRTRVLLTAYLLGKLPDVRVCGDGLPYTKLARLAFGEQRLKLGIDRIVTHLSHVGYSARDVPTRSRARSVLSCFWPGAHFWKILLRSTFVGFMRPLHVSNTRLPRSPASWFPLAS
jgi:hypothetical protein